MGSVEVNHPSDKASGVLDYNEITALGHQRIGMLCHLELGSAKGSGISKGGAARDLADRTECSELRRIFAAEVGGDVGAGVGQDCVCSEEGTVVRSPCERLVGVFAQEGDRSTGDPSAPSL